MKTQTSFSGLEYAAKRKQTRRDCFLGDIDAVTPWRDLVAVIEPFYPKGERGRPPIGVERMLRRYVAQQGFGLADEGIEDAVYNSPAIRRFVGIDLAREPRPMRPPCRASAACSRSTISPPRSSAPSTPTWPIGAG